MLTNNIPIQLALIADASTIAAMSRDDIEYGLGWSWTTSRVEHSIRHRDVNVVVARDAGVVAGFGIMKYGEDGASLNLLAVKKEYRRRGVGSRIIAWLERVAMDSGLFEIVVQLRDNNKTARVFYETLGFEVVDHVPGYYRNQELGLVMAKQLGTTPL